MVLLRRNDATDHPSGRVYLGRCPERNLLLTVCVEETSIAGRPQLIVKTAYLCRTSGPGEQLWP
jgi:hypothetical protein